MKILTDNNLVNLVTPGVFSGFKASILDSNIMSIYDSFDIVNPDLYIGDLNNLNNTIIKNIEERPHLKTFFIGDNEENLSLLKSRIGNSFEWTKSLDFGNVLKYYNQPYVDKLKCDIVCIEDFAIDGLEQLIISPNFKYRIFSNVRIVRNNNYCGFIQDNIKASIIKSSRYAIVNKHNKLNTILCDCWPITDISLANEEIYIDYTNTIKEEKEDILSSKTNFHALSYILNKIGYVKESELVINKLKEIL